MARSRTNNGRDGALIRKWHWKYQGVSEQLSSHLCGEDELPVGPEGRMEQTEDKRPLLVKDQVLDIELRLLEEMVGDTLPRTVKAVEFKLVCKALDLCVIGPDIEALRVAMWAQLEKAHAIKWEQWYLIQIAPAQSFKGELETGFALSQNTIYRGVARDGTVLMREYPRDRTSGPWRYAAWPAEYEDKGGHVLACIPATEANKAALNEFRSMIRALQERLSDLVKPDVILKTLANLTSLGLPKPSKADLLESFE